MGLGDLAGSALPNRFSRRYRTEPGPSQHIPAQSVTGRTRDAMGRLNAPCVSSVFVYFNTAPASHAQDTSHPAGFAQSGRPQHNPPPVAFLLPHYRELAPHRLHGGHWCTPFPLPSRQCILSLPVPCREMKRVCWVTACQFRDDSSTPTLVPVLHPSGTSPGTSASASPYPILSVNGDGTEFGLQPRATENTAVKCWRNS